VTATHRLSDRVAWLVGRASMRAQRLINDRFADAELRKQHYGILASLADRGPATQAPLADRLGLDRSDLVSLLDDLEARKYVVRRADPGDRRRKIVEITARGGAMLKKLDQLIFAADDEMLAVLTPEERATLARLLERILPPADRGQMRTPSGPVPEHMCAGPPPAAQAATLDPAQRSGSAAGAASASRPPASAGPGRQEAAATAKQAISTAGSDGAAKRA
jgi:DNA-binding MarR family transcriptional regulator